MLGDLKPIKEGTKMIEDFTKYDTVEEGECFTTGIIDEITIAPWKFNDYHYFIDSKGNEWVIKEMEDGPPIMVAKEKEDVG